MTKQFEFKTILPTEKELKEIGPLEFQLDFDAEKEMLNHLEISKIDHQIDVDIEGNVLTISYRPNWHYGDVNGSEVIVKGNVVPKAASLRKKIKYADQIEKVDLTTSVDRLIEMHEEDELILDPAYQRDFVWTEDQKRLYIKNLFEDKAEITPTIVEYYDDTHTHVYEVLDGKQRIKALIDFYNNEFDVEGLYFKDLTAEDQFFFTHHRVVYTRVMNRANHLDLKLETKIQLFLEINMLGTRMSDEDLAKAQALINK